MRPELLAFARKQSGLVTRRQAKRAGYSEREIRSHLAVHGPWTVVRRGVYVDSAHWQSLGVEDQWRLRDRAVDLTTGVVHAMCADSAARAHRLPFLLPARPLSHLVRPGVFGTRSEHGVKHHLSRLMPAPLVTVDGMTVTPLGRTALDVGREHGFEAGLAACDAALRRGVTRSDLRAELDRMRCWPHITRARAAVDHADPGAETIAESMARALVAELGLGWPATQFPVRTERGVVWCDLRLGNHVFELDGKIKYVDRARGGVADRAAEQVVWDEKKRQRAIAAVGLGVSRIVWQDFWGDHREAARKRMLGELEVSEARFGPVLAPHLAQEADRLRDVRRARILRPAG